MKKVLAFIMCLGIAISAVGCGGDSGGSSNGGTGDLSRPENTSSLAATTGTIDVEIAGCKIVKDVKDNDAVLITYKFTNNTSKKQNFRFAVNPQVKQGENILEAAVVSEATGFDATLGTKNLENGESIEVYVGYILKDTTTPIDVTCKRLAGEDKTDVTGQLTLE